MTGRRRLRVAVTAAACALLFPLAACGTNTAGDSSSPGTGDTAGSADTQATEATGSDTAATSPATGATSGTSQTRAGGKVEIGVSEINLSLPFFVHMQDASKQIASAYGVNVTWQSADGALDKQISTIENFIRQKKDVIMIDPISAEALVPVVNKATDAGIKVITMGNKVKGKANVSTLYPDYENMAINARVLGNAINGKGTVLLLVGTAGNYVSDTRQAGFVDTMKKDFPDVKVVTQATNWDSAVAARVTQTVMTQNKDLAGIASISDGMTLPAMKVLEARKKIGMPVVSYDGDPASYPYIEKGQILSNILTGDYRVGAWNTAVAARLGKGSKLSRDVFMPTYTIMTNTELAQKAGVKDSVTPKEATGKAKAYAEEFGPKKSDADMSVK